MTRPGERVREPEAQASIEEAVPAETRSPPASILALQRSAGNQAVSQALTQQVQRDPFSWMKKKLTGKSSVSKPKDAKPMKPEEQGGVLSMKQLIEIYENTAKTVSGKDRQDLGEDTVDALSGLALKTEEKASFIEQIAEAVTGGVMGTGGT